MKYAALIIALLGSMSIYGQTHPIDTIRIDSAQILFTPTRTQFFEHMLSDSSAATGLDLGELLSKNSSIHINNYGAGSSQSISLRGTGSQHTKVYWNGFAIESPTLGSMDLSTVAGVLNNGVDVLPGLSSNRLGSGGLGGAISINADSFDDKNSFGLSLGGNSLLSRQIQAHANLNLNQWDYAINFFSNQEENRFSFVNNAQYEAPLDTMENAAFEQYSLNQAIRYKTDKHEFILHHWYNEIDRQLPKTITSASFGEDSQWDRQNRLSFSYKGVGRKYILEVATFLSREEQIFNYGQQAHNDFQTWQNRVRIKRYLPRDFSLTGTIRLNAAEAKTDGYPNGADEVRSSALVVLEKQGIKQSFEASIQAETADYSFIPLMPSAHYVRKITPFLEWRIGGGYNVRFAGLNDRFWLPGGNPDLRPEKAWSTESGFLLNKNWDNLVIRYEGHVFHGIISDWILWQPGENFWSASNVQEVLHQGLENRLNASWSLLQELKINLQLSHSLTRSEQQSSDDQFAGLQGKQLIYIPTEKWMAQARISWNKKWDFGIRMTHTGSRFIDAENTTWMPDYQLVDCWLGYSNQLWEQTFSVKAGIDNLFNQAYQIMPYRPLPGRVFQIQINIQIEQK